tara:strand:- start:3683 stop:3877 length:195 start_codon:yes stop_codon:yes gene_type:complete
MGVELVSRCCGASFEEVEEVESWDEIYICDECLDFCEVQNDYDYRGLRLYDIAEAREDDKRCGL